MIRVIITGLFVLLLLGAQAQVTGFLGRRCFVQARVSLSPNHGFALDDGSYGLVSEQRFSVNAGYSGDLNYIISDNFILGAGFESSTYKASFYNCVLNYTNQDEFWSANVLYRKNIFKLYTEFHRKSEYPLLNFYYRFGAAYANIQNVDYENFYFERNGNTFECSAPTNYATFDLNQHTGTFGVYWELGNRIPIGQRLLLYYGLSGYVFSRWFPDHFDFQSEAFMDSEDDEFIEELGRRQLLWSSLISNHIGICIVL